ncbi:hypothetical protein D9M72_590410 [compost metagenome]
MGPGGSGTSRLPRCTLSRTMRDSPWYTCSSMAVCASEPGMYVFERLTGTVLLRSMMGSKCPCAEVLAPSRWLTATPSE